MSKLIIFRGLPGSGKSTQAKELVNNQVTSGNTKIFIVCRDDIRTANGFDLKPGDFENTVTHIQHSMIRNGLRDGYTVISADTSLKHKYVKEMMKIAVECNANIEFIDCDLPLEECIIRDSLRKKPVGEKVIRNMYARFFSKGFPKRPQLENSSSDFMIPYTLTDGIPTYIVDLDGTVAINDGHRDFFDYSKVLYDKPNWPVIEVVKTLSRNADTVFVSGRDDWCKNDTETWLRKVAKFDQQFFYYMHLYMRKTGDKRPDYIVKYEIFDEHLRKRKILGVFDDRPQVLRMWRNIDVPTFDVGKGIEF